MNRVDANPEFLINSDFSDEATFQLNGEVNRQNMRYYIEQWKSSLVDWKPHTKWNFWTGLHLNGIIGHFFIDGNLIGVRHLKFITTCNDFNDVWSQQETM